MAELAKKRDIPVFYAQKGDIWNNFPGKGMSMECLSPDGGTRVHGPELRNPWVFRLTYGRFSMLLTGDMETSGEETLLTSGVLTPVTILKPDITVPPPHPAKIYRKTVPIRDDPLLRKKEPVRTSCGESPEAAFRTRIKDL